MPRGERTPTTALSTDSSSNGSPEKSVKSRRKVNYKVKYKTEICKTWELNGVCSFGDKCAFAHGSREIRSKVHVPANYKTKPCTQFHERGFCKFGSRCQFRHETVQDEGEEKLRTSSDPEPYTGASFSYRDHLRAMADRMGDCDSASLSKVLVDKEVHYMSDDVPRPRLKCFQALARED